MKKITLTICLLLASCIVFAGKLQLIPTSETNASEPVLKNKNLITRSPQSIVTYPTITEPDEDVLHYISQVSIDRIMADIQTLENFVTRRCDHSNSVLAQNWLIEQYEPFNLEVSVQALPDIFPWWGGVVQSDNVIAVQYGTKFPDEYVICGAHYDSFAYGASEEPGADDNASGTAGIIEIARILSQYEFERSIIYCAFTAEESGRHGSEYYAEQCANEDMNIIAYFNMDMIGYLQPGEEIKIHFSNPLSAKILADYCENVCEVYFPEIPFSYNHYMSRSDHRSFIDAGYMGITSIEYDFTANPYYHKPDDIIGLGVNSPELVETFVKANLASIATLAMQGGTNNIIELNSKFKIYPNPTTGELRIENGEWRIENVEIFDIYGRKQKAESRKQNVVNISHLPAGVYILKIANEFVEKIIKK